MHPTPSPALYCVRLTTWGWQQSYLSHRGRTAWSLRTAHKHARDLRNSVHAYKYAAIEVLED